MNRVAPGHLAAARGLDDGSVGGEVETQQLLPDPRGSELDPQRFGQKRRQQRYPSNIICRWLLSRVM